MRIPDETRDQLSAKFAVLFPHLDERQRRLLRGAEARLLGHGGIRAVARAAQVSETTVRDGVFELESGDDPTGVRIKDAEMAALPLTRHAFQGAWNYALHPQPSPVIPAARAPQTPDPPGLAL